jgi:hypothetical protein
MTNDDGRKPEGAPERSPKAGVGVPSGDGGNGRKRFSVAARGTDDLKKERSPPGALARPAMARSPEGAVEQIRPLAL